MSDWNADWGVRRWCQRDILQEARKEKYLLELSQEEIDQLPNDDDGDFVSSAEERYRLTWEVKASSYYKHFRFAVSQTSSLKHYTEEM